MIKKFYIDKAFYKIEDNTAKTFLLEIDYWNNKYKLSEKNEKLKVIAIELLKKKHGVNFAPKLIK